MQMTKMFLNKSTSIIHAQASEVVDIM